MTLSARTIIMLAAALTGCASPMGISMSSPEQLHQAYFYDLCDSWLVMKDPRVLDELRSRHLYTAEEMGQITNHTISVGMSASAARCSWGGSYDENVSNFGGGPLYQRAYRDSNAYVYVRDDKVTGYQN